jgi:hypothetical protein
LGAQNPKVKQLQADVTATAGQVLQQSQVVEDKAVQVRQMQDTKKKVEQQLRENWIKENPPAIKQNPPSAKFTEREQEIVAALKAEGSKDAAKYERNLVQIEKFRAEMQDSQMRLVVQVRRLEELLVVEQNLVANLGAKNAKVQEVTALIQEVAAQNRKLRNELDDQSAEVEKMRAQNVFIAKDLAVRWLEKNR